MKTQKAWYIIYTSEGDELKTYELLKKKHFECFCPTQKQGINARYKSQLNPLLPNYIFVHATQQEHVLIKQIKGVVNFMYWLGDFAIMPEEELYALKKVVDTYNIIDVEKIGIRHMESSMIVKEYLTNNCNDFEADADMVKISFPSCGYQLMARTNKTSVRLINASANDAVTEVMQGKKQSILFLKNLQQSS